MQSVGSLFALPTDSAKQKVVVQSLTFKEEDEWGMAKTNLILGLIGAVLLVTGCQSTPSQLTESKNSDFMSLWSAYADCKTTSDLSQATSDLRQLRSASFVPDEKDSFVLPLPTQLSRLVNHQTSRVAVDVHAMAVACALHTGELALNQGYGDLARDFLTSVMSMHQEKDSYYVMRAKTLLARLGQGINVSFIPR